MNPRSLWLRGGRACVMIAFVLGLTGCAASYRVQGTADPMPEHLPESVQPIKSLALAVVHVRRIEGGIGVNVPRSTVRRIVGEIREQGVFSHVFEPRDSFRAPQNRIRLVVTLREEFDRHRVSNHLRQVAALSTMFISTVLLPLEYDGYQAMEFDFQFSDGGTVAYRSSTEGRVIAHDVTYAWYSEIRKRLTSRNLEAMLERIRCDMGDSPNWTR